MSSTPEQEITFADLTPEQQQELVSSQFMNSFAQARAVMGNDEAFQSAVLTAWNNLLNDGSDIDTEEVTAPLEDSQFEPVFVVVDTPPEAPAAPEIELPALPAAFDPETSTYRYVLEEGEVMVFRVNGEELGPDVTTLPIADSPARSFVPGVTLMLEPLFPDRSNPTPGLLEDNPAYINPLKEAVTLLNPDRIRHETYKALLNKSASVMAEQVVANHAADGKKLDYRFALQAAIKHLDKSPLAAIVHGDPESPDNMLDLLVSRSSTDAVTLDSIDTRYLHIVGTPDAEGKKTLSAMAVKEIKRGNPSRVLCVGATALFDDLVAIGVPKDPTPHLLDGVDELDIQPGHRLSVVSAAERLDTEDNTAADAETVRSFKELVLQHIVHTVLPAAETKTGATNETASTATPSSENTAVSAAKDEPHQEHAPALPPQPKKPRFPEHELIGQSRVALDTTSLSRRDRKRLGL